MARSHRTSAVGALAMIASADAVVAAERAPERLVSGDRLLASSVTGVSARLRVEPDVPGMALLRAETARAVSPRTGRLDMIFAVGSARLRADTAVSRIDLGDAPRERRAA